MDFWNRIWLYLYDKRVLEIEKIFHQTPGLGDDVGCLQSLHYKPDFQENSRIERFPKFVIKLLAVYGSVFIYAVFFIFSVVILIIGLTQIGRS